MILSAIAAMAKNRVIGVKNALPWNLPEDLKYFKEKTKGHVMIMGRKTFESFGGKPLPNRFHIVITRQQDYKFDHPQVQVVHDFKMALELAHMLTDKYQAKFGDEVFVIGGGEIYSQTMELLDRLYLTVIDHEFEGDAYFPKFNTDQFKLTQDLQKNEPMNYSFKVYERL